MSHIRALEAASRSDPRLQLPARAVGCFVGDSCYGYRNVTCDRGLPSMGVSGTVGLSQNRTAGSFLHLLPPSDLVSANG